MKLFLLLLVVFGADTLIAQIEMVETVATIPLPPEAMPWYGVAVQKFMQNFPDINGWFMAVMGFLMVALRAAAELLSFIAAKTETKTDDRIAKEVHRLFLWASKFVGWFGAGAPKGKK